MLDMNITVSGVKSEYMPGEHVSAVMFLESKYDCVISSSKFSIIRSEGVKYNVTPAVNLCCFTWAISKNYQEDTISHEISGKDVTGTIMTKGKHGRSGHKLMFIIPDDIPKSSIAIQDGSTHFNKYFIRFEFNISSLNINSIPSFTKSKGTKLVEIMVVNPVPIYKTPTKYMNVQSYSLGPFKNKMGMVCMIKCNTNDPLPGEEITTHVSLLKLGNRTVRNISLTYFNTVKVLDKESINTGHEIFKKGCSVKTLRGLGESKQNDLFELKRVIDSGDGIVFKTVVPPYFMCGKKLKDASILEKGIIVKCHFYTGMHCVFRFVISNDK